MGDDIEPEELVDENEPGLFQKEIHSLPHHTWRDIWRVQLNT